MKKLPWYPFFWDDYSSKTTDLSQGQHGAYILLLKWVYVEKQGVPDDRRYSIARAMLEPERQDTDFILARFFQKKHGYWHNRKATEVMKEARKKHQSRVLAGQKGGLAKSSNATILPEQCSTNPQPTTHPEEVSKNLLSGFSVGKKNGSGKSDEYKLSKFAQTLANSFPDRKAGWVLIEAALDINHLHHATAIKACKIQAKSIEKGWPHKWPQV